MVTISKATATDFNTIRTIAHKTWPSTYGKIITKEQLDYMLDMFYSDETLGNNLNEKNHFFLLATENENCLGFASYENNFDNKNKTHLHKIYVLPEAQGNRVGELLIEAVENAAKNNHSVAISLFVNKFNRAITFYQKKGFKIVSEVCQDIGKGYVMDDYAMEKEL
jgi:ribosomal protein S18 acetylase RimI-like enzyme